MVEPKPKANVTPGEIKELLDYLPETGELFWKPRPLKFFNEGEGRYTAERSKRIFDKLFAGKPALNCPNLNGYLRGNLFGRLMLSHRAAFAIMEGRWPNQVDHINGVRSDNRWLNLREATNKQNQYNSASAKGSSSKYVGVSFDSKAGKWAAYLCPEGKKIHLGYAEDELSAAKMRDAAAQKMFGEYARLNLPAKQ